MMMMIVGFQFVSWKNHSILRLTGPLFQPPVLELNIDRYARAAPDSLLSLLPSIARAHIKLFSEFADIIQLGFQSSK